MNARLPRRRRRRVFLLSADGGGGGDASCGQRRFPVRSYAMSDCQIGPRPARNAASTRARLRKAPRSSIEVRDHQRLEARTVK